MSAQGSRQHQIVAYESARVVAAIAAEQLVCAVAGEGDSNGLAGITAQVPCRYRRRVGEWFTEVRKRGVQHRRVVHWQCLTMMARAEMISGDPRVSALVV